MTLYQELRRRLGKNPHRGKSKKSLNSQPLWCVMERIIKKTSPKASPSITPYFCERPQEEKNLQFHNIFVGSLQVTLPNLHKKRSFGFKPGVKRVHLKNTSASETSMEQLLPLPTIYQYEDYDLSGIVTSPIHNHTSLRDSNKTFDPGGLH